MNTPIDRKAFLRSALGCVAACAVASRSHAADSAPMPSTAAAVPQPPKPSDPGAADARTVFKWLSPFIVREEKTLERGTLVKLLEERGRLCCRLLGFRQKLIADSQGDVNKLVELMGKIVGPENCTRQGDVVTLVYPQKCGCVANPKREPSPDDPYCECSKSNNQTLFQIVSGRAVSARVVESPRRGGQVCRFLITLGQSSAGAA